MIDTDRQIIFFHIPKTAGMSVGTAVFGATYQHDVELCARVASGRVDIDRYTKFCFVRNPWDRMLSLYHQARKPLNLKVRRRRLAYDLATALPFDQWIRASSEIDPLVLTGGGFFDRVTDAEGAVHVDFVGRFERIHEDFETLCRRLHIAPSPLPHINGSRHAMYAHYYTPLARDTVHRLFEREIDWFGYRFGCN